MSKRCDLSGKGVMTGNNVSHAHNKTRRRFMPNLQQISLFSDALNQQVRLRLTASTVRTVEKRGGLDSFLMKANASDLTPEIRRLKKRIKKAIEVKAA
ncbi:MAG: 50S ribosomal protein L28 [Rhodospirillales bacterium]|jgi:large subunit ribosomal protein L28